jgi:hypothetical protein
LFRIFEPKPRWDSSTSFDEEWAEEEWLAAEGWVFWPMAAAARSCCSRSRVAT